LRREKNQNDPIQEQKHLIQSQTFQSFRKEGLGAGQVKFHPKVIWAK